MVSSGFSDPEAVSGSSTKKMNKKIIHLDMTEVIFYITGNLRQEKDR